MMTSEDWCITDYSIKQPIHYGSMLQQQLLDVTLLCVTLRTANKLRIIGGEHCGHCSQYPAEMTAAVTFHTAMKRKWDFYVIWNTKIRRADV